MAIDDILYQRVLDDITEDQAFSLSHDLALPPDPSPPFPSASCPYFLTVSCVSPVELTEGGEVVVGGGAESDGGEKAWSSINLNTLWYEENATAEGTSPTSTIFGTKQKKNFRS